MAVQKVDIYVYADWQGLEGPLLMGVLSAHQAKGRKAFSFSYDKQWLKSGHQYRHVAGAEVRRLLILKLIRHFTYAIEG